MILYLQKVVGGIPPEEPKQEIDEVQFYTIAYVLVILRPVCVLLLCSLRLQEHRVGSGKSLMHPTMVGVALEELDK